MQTEQVSAVNSFQPHKNLQIWLMYSIFISIFAVFVPLFLGGAEYTWTELFLAGVLLSLCLYPATRFLANKEQGLPTFPIFCLAYAVQFALPIFTRDATIVLISGKASLGEEEVVASLFLAIVGIIALEVAYYGMPHSKLLRVFPAISIPINTKKAVLFSLVFGLIVPLATRADDLLPSQFTLQFSAIVKVLQNQALVAIVILAGIHYANKSKIWIRLLLYLILLLATTQGISSGMLELALVPLLSLLLAHWYYYRKLPIRSLVIILALFLFLSPVKQNYREAVWYGESSSSQPLDSASDKVVFWFQQASEYWLNVLGGEKNIDESTGDASSRLDLLHPLAHIYSRTPSVIPYQYGATYSFFLVALIPRFLWPDKPEAGSANYFYAVNYEITTEEGARRSTFGVSIVGESYINFGWVGVVLIMGLQGVVLSLLQHMFGTQDSRLGGHAVYIAFFVYFLNGIGTSAEILFGNILQCLFLSIVLLWWIREKQGDQSAHSAGILSPLSTK